MAHISKGQAARIWRLVEYRCRNGKMLTTYRLLRALRLPLQQAKELEELVFLGFFGPVYQGPSRTVDELRRRTRSTQCFTAHRAFFPHGGRYHCIRERPRRHTINSGCLV